MKIELTSSLEDYLETIYKLCEKEAHAHITDIAGELSLSKPSVHRAVSQLRDAGLVNQEPYGQVTITDLGRKYALGIVQRHQLIKRFLCEMLGVDKEVAEQEACQMEHAISHDTAQKLADFLSFALDDKESFRCPFTSCHVASSADETDASAAKS